MSDRHVNATRTWYTRNAVEAIAAHLGLQLDNDGKPTGTGAPGTSRDRSAHDAVGGMDAGLRGALVELADEWLARDGRHWLDGLDEVAGELRALLAAHPASRDDTPDPPVHDAIGREIS